MSWHYSLALVAEFSERTYSEQDRCARLRSNRIAERSFFDGKTKATYRRSLSGMTRERLMENLGVALWMSSLEASRANRSVKPGKVSPKTILEICGLKQSESFAKWNRRSASWKTSQDSSAKRTSKKSSGSFPRRGIGINGMLFQQPKLEQTTSEKGCGYWPTPQTHDSVPGKPGRQSRHGTKHGCRNLNDAVADSMLPTPTASDHQTSRLKHKRGNATLLGAAMVPTPTATDATKWSQKLESERRDQGSSVRLSNLPAFPTPKARDAKVPGGSVRKSSQDSGSANPDWWEVEPEVGRVVDGLAYRVDQLKAIGNGQVPRVVVEAWNRLAPRI